MAGNRNSMVIATKTAVIVAILTGLIILTLLIAYLVYLKSFINNNSSNNVFKNNKPKNSNNSIRLPLSTGASIESLNSSIQSDDNDDTKTSFTQNLNKFNVESNTRKKEKTHFDEFVEIDLNI